MVEKAVVYSAKTCPKCVMLKDYLEENKAEYEERLVDKDADALAELIGLTGEIAVPVLKMNGKVVKGFDREALDSAFGNR